MISKIRVMGQREIEQTTFDEPSVLNDLQHVMLSTTKKYLRQVETTWDINNGLCEEWSSDVCDAVPEAEAVWLTVYDSEANHSAVLYLGRWYDAECPDGVDDWHNLPFWTNRHRSRADVLHERNSNA